jgi:hypothetical protein
VSRGLRNESPRPVISVFYTGAATFLSSSFLNYPHEAEWTPFQTHYFSENLVAPGIEPETSGFIASFQIYQEIKKNNTDSQESPIR